ncbi:MAG TPA: CARDB domain-containing protein [Thermoanaerobaculia bacterium]|nr:CARDB domain-containing protein [Thermoanaerobaculia bacterium]
MRRLALFAIFAFAATIASAAVSDVRTSINVPASLKPGETITFTATVENLGPDVARDVRWYVALQYRFCHEDTLVEMQPGERRTVSCTASAEDAEGYFVRPRTYAYPQNSSDPDESNNYSEAFVGLETPPDLFVFGSNAGFVDAALPFTLTIELQNAAATAAENVTLDIDLPGILSFGDVPSPCSVLDTHLICPLGTIAAATPRPLQLQFHPIAPDASAARIEGSVTLRASNGEATPANNRSPLVIRTYRTSFVTNTNDSGAGSLRAAIDDANQPVSDGFERKIAFRIGGNALVQTIRVSAPMPVITTPQLLVDALTQARYFHDNPNGLEIELAGETAGADANGLTITGCAVSVLGLNIHGFSGAGIDHRGGANCNRPSIAQNFIGTDVTGSVAMPNGRGIVVAGWPLIEKNVISGNRRSGIWVAAPTLIRDNIIGLAADRHTPLGNGASGVYVAASANGSGIAGNSIAFNHDFGVATDAAAKNVTLLDNSIHANWQLGIDRGLDGPTAELKPVITRAQFEAATNKTIIEALVSAQCDLPVFSFYANDPGGDEGQYPLRSFTGTGAHIEVPADLRGQWITATFECGVGDFEPHGFVYTGSEFSAAVPVQ